MCGRYILAPEESQEIAEIIQQVQDRIQTGEIFPTNPVPVLAELGVAVMDWGFPRFQGKSGCIINARSETALERPMFRKSIVERRCVFPTTGFYEWGPDGRGKKIKYRLHLPGEDKALYLAGLWNEFAGQFRCVVLTTAANESMADIHDRMPVILRRKDLDTWIHDTEHALMLMQAPQPALMHTSEEGQTSLFS